MFFQLLLFFTVFVAPSITVDNTEEGVVNTNCGPVKGVPEKVGASTVWYFKGMPYAVPPVGERRWKPPQLRSKSDGTCWKGTYDASHFGSECIQPPRGTTVAGTEDCLFVNVISPTLSSTAKLPVLVWLHGGSLIAGNGNIPGYTPNVGLAKDMNIVTVSFNYRLGALGFLALEELSKESPLHTSGNYGLLDCIAVLQWVQDNIENFGGDPHSVTLFGQSSGATLQYALLATPSAKNLYHRSWLASGSPQMNDTLAFAEETNKYMYKTTKCSDLACLRKTSADQIAIHTAWNFFPNWDGPYSFALPHRYSKGQMNPINVDGVVLADTPNIAWKEGKGNYVPLIVGTCAQEIDLAPQVNMQEYTWEQYRQHVKAVMGQFGNATVEAAFELYPEEISPQYVYTTMASDIGETCPESLITEDLVPQSVEQPVYRYVSTAWPHPPQYRSPTFSVKYSFHTSDAVFFFNETGTPPGAAQNQYCIALRRAIGEFMRTGKIDDWHSFHDGWTMVLGDYGEFLPLPGQYHAAQCKYWMEHGFFKYSWNN